MDDCSYYPHVVRCRVVWIVMDGDDDGHVVIDYRYETAADVVVVVVVVDGGIVVDGGKGVGKDMGKGTGSEVDVGSMVVVDVIVFDRFKFAIPTTPSTPTVS